MAFDWFMPRTNPKRSVAFSCSLPVEVVAEITTSPSVAVSELEPDMVILASALAKVTRMGKSTVICSKSEFR